MLDALDYSHRQGVIHRDIKPANIFLLTDGSVKVADFGIAHIESSNLTQVGTVLGTPSYMSPEQIMGLPVDGRSDLFSAGVILYQFLTGERPFAGSATTTMQKVLKEDPLPPSIAQRSGAAGDGRRRAQGAGQACRRTLPDAPGNSPTRSARGGVDHCAGHRRRHARGSTDATIIVPLDGAKPMPAATAQRQCRAYSPSRRPPSAMAPPPLRRRRSARNPALA